MSSPQLSPRPKSNNAERWFWPIMAAVVGVVVEIAIATMSGRRESWDSGAYWTIGMPAMIVAAFVIGRINRQDAVIVGYAPFVGQFVTMALRTGVGSLWVMGLIFTAILGLTGVAAAVVGSRLGRR